MKVCMGKKRPFKNSTNHHTKWSANGLNSIAIVHNHINPEQLQMFFPDLSLNELVRRKDIQLLMSHREGRLVPLTVQAVGDPVLWDGPLGKTVGGTHPELFEEHIMSAYNSKTNFKKNKKKEDSKVEKAF